MLQSEAKAPEAYERARQALMEAGSQTAEVEGQFVDRAVSEEKTAPAALRVRRVTIGK